MLRHVIREIQKVPLRALKSRKFDAQNSQIWFARTHYCEVGVGCWWNGVGNGKWVSYLLLFWINYEIMDYFMMN
jgi:hypothetical protein